MTEPYKLDLLEARAALRRGELSARELVDSCLERIEHLDGELGAFALVDAEGARARADELDGVPVTGPLHGIPVAIKDLADVAGMPTRASSAVLAQAPPAAADSPLVARLRSAGAVIVGKTHTHEFAFGVVTPTTRNPWDTARIPGGSSGGSAVAVATGMATAALGTDTAGSIRIPSALCGVTGLMARPGTLDMDGIVPLAPSLDTAGPIVRSAAGARVVFEVLTGETTGAEARRDITVAAPEAPSAIIDLDPEVEDAVEGAIAALVAEGATRVTAALPHLDAWDRARVMPLMAEALEVHRKAGWWPNHADAYTEETRSNLITAEAVTAEDLERCREESEVLVARLLEALGDADVLALPVTPSVAPTHEDAAAVDPASFRRPVARALTRLCGPVNRARLASIAVPCGLSSAGLPIGIQFVARDEGRALSAALAYQEVGDHHLRRPPD